MAAMKGQPEKPRAFGIIFADVYPLYVAKAAKKGRSRAEVDEVIRWLTGYTAKGLQRQVEAGSDLESFFAKAPKMNPARRLISGVICGVRVEDIEDPTMQAIRYMDKLVDELSKGRAMEKILRSR